MKARDKQRARQAHKAENSRSCGQCNACCTTQGVAEINKEAGVPCRSLAATKGCSVYDTRPQPCKDWSCMWKYGAFEGADRPDRIGVVMDVTTKSAAWGDGHALVARETFPGGFEKARGFLDNLARTVVVVMIQPSGTRRIIGPPEKVAQAQEMLRRLLPVV